MIYLKLAALYLAMSTLGTYLAFYRFTSDSWILQFGVWSDKENPDMSERDLAVKKFVYSNSLRSILLGIIVLILIYLFTADVGGIETILQFSLYRIGVAVTLIGVGLWCFIFGPKKLAKKFDTPVTWKEHRRPYISNYINIASPISVLAPLMFGAIIIGIKTDYVNLVAEISSLGRAVNCVGIANLLDFQISVFDLIDFGHRYAQLAQKYMVGGLLLFMYTLAEQKTNMRHTMLPSSVDKLKFAAWIIMLAGFSIGVIILPTIFSILHDDYHMAFGELISGISTFDEVEKVLMLQEQLEAHDLDWFFLEVLTGFGNIITLAVVGFAWFLRKVVFKNATFGEILRLLLPSQITNIIEMVSEQIGLDLNTPVESE